MVAHRRDHHVLSATRFVGDGVGLTACRQHGGPQGLARLDVDGAEQVVRRRGDEDQTACRHHRAAVVRRADVEGQEGRDAERAIAPGRAKRAVPERLSRLEVDCADAAIGRAGAGHACPGVAPAGVDRDAIGRTLLRIGCALGAAPGFLLACLTVDRFRRHLVTRHKPVVIRHVVVVRDDDPAFGVHRDGAPVGPAVVARILDPRPVRRRRGEEALIVRAAILDAAPELVDGGEAPHVLLFQRRFAQRVPFADRLGVRDVVRLDLAFRQVGQFADRGQRLARLAVQDVDVALFRRQQHRGRTLIVEQRRLTAEVVIPHIVPHGLEVPDLLARGGVERDERRGVLVFHLAPVGAVVVDRGIAERQIDIAQFFVRDRRGPHVGRTARVDLALGRTVAVLLGRGKIPCPGQLAGHGVIAAHDAGRRVFRLTVLHLGAGDDDPADDGRRRGHGVPAGHTFADVLPQVDGAVFAEVLARRAVFHINGDQFRIERRLDHARRAGVPVGRTGIGIGRNAPARGAVGDGLVRDARIEAPVLLSGLGIHGDQDIHGGAHQEVVADLQRRDLGRILPFRCALGQVAGVEGEDFFELTDVFRSDLVQRRITGGLRVTAPEGPVRTDLRLGTRRCVLPGICLTRPFVCLARPCGCLIRGGGLFCRVINRFGGHSFLLRCRGLLCMEGKSAGEKRGCYD